MSTADLAAKADRFLKLHHGPGILVLANVWDVASARIVEHAGFQAIATSSAAVANSLGYPDGERISRGEMLEAVRRIAAKVSVPVSADFSAINRNRHGRETARLARSEGNCSPDSVA